MNSDLSSEMTVKALIDRHPELIQTFMELGLACVGCPTEDFHTLSDVAREYALDLGQLQQGLDLAICADEASQMQGNTRNKGE